MYTAAPDSFETILQMQNHRLPLLDAPCSRKIAETIWGGICHTFQTALQALYDGGEQRLSYAFEILQGDDVLTQTRVSGERHRTAEPGVRRRRATCRG